MTHEALAAWLFLRVLGLVHVVAFVSFRVQLRGLVGSNGLMPAVELDRVLPPGRVRWLRAPSLFWLRPTDRFLAFLCDAGIVLGALLTLGILQGPATLGLWALYLSLCTVSGRFLGYQWDVLLVETTLAATLVAPWRLGPVAVEPSVLAVAVLRFLVFRLMFFSGYVKLRSGDRTWRDLTALAWHYESQPLPNPLSRWFHQRPLWFHRVSTLFNHVVELVVPWLVFLPQPCPAIAAAAFALLLGLLQITGNFGFFQLLSLALCVPLLADVQWLALCPWLTYVPVAAAWPWRDAVVVPVAVVLLGLAALQAAAQVVPARLPVAALRVLDAIAPFRSVNHYGLFAVMTTERPEIVLEASDDGVTWHPYELRYKPGDLDRTPPIAAPHMPRLDWQLWFAALGSCATDRWVLVLQAHLLRGTPEVLALFRKVPLSHPKYVRSLLYRYRFAGSAEAADEVGRVWQRKLEGPYCPAMKKPDGE